MPKNSRLGRMEQHIEKSERKSGKSKKESERIAFATVNKQKAKEKKKRGKA